MTDTFKPGEVAIYVRPGSLDYGEEVTVVSREYMFRGGIDRRNNMWVPPGELGYEIIDRNGKCFANSEWLRKKKPPSREIDQVTSWNRCAWKPREMVDA